MKKIDLSIIVLSYNTKELLSDCLASIKKCSTEASFEVIVPDNASSDGSPEMIKDNFPNYKLILSSKNLGFAGGNNLARKYAQGKYILFLNSDTILYKGTITAVVKYMDEHKDVGALTCKLLLANGLLDKDTRHSFISPWIGLTHLFFRLDELFPKSKLFGRYWYGYMNEDKVHEVDVIQGAFFFTRKEILDKLNWFDDTYFLDGEDIDICWRIKKVLGYKIVYFPKVLIRHFKGSSKGKATSSEKTKVPLSERLKFRMAGVNSMEIFYRKWMWASYPLVINIFVIIGIKTIKISRFLSTVISG